MQTAMHHAATASSMPPCVTEEEMTQARNLFKTRQFEAAREYCRQLPVLPDSRQEEELLRLRGMIHVALGHGDVAALLFAELTSRHPGNATDLYHLGLLLQQQGEITRATAAFDAALALTPDLAEAHLARGNALMVDNRPAEAVAAYLSACRHSSCAAKAYYNLAMAYLKLELQPAAIQALQKAAAAGSADAALWSLLGDLLKDEGRLSEAAQAYQEVCRHAPDRIEACEKLGDILLQVGDHAGAIPPYRALLARQPHHLKALNNLGLALQQMGQADEAIVIYHQALDLSRAVAETHFNLGNALVAQGNREKAFSAFQEAVRLKPAYGEAWFNLGIVCQKLRLLEEAEAAYQRVLEIKGPGADTFFNLGLVLQVRKRQGEAIAAYDKAVALAPDHALAHYNRAIALGESGRKNEAIAGFRRARDLAPENVNILNNLALTLLDQGELDEAAMILRQAIALKPDFAEALSNLGNVYQQQRRYQEAMRTYEEAVARDPRFARGYYNQGCLLLEKNEPAAAAAMYRKAIELEPELIEAHWNLSNALLVQGELAEGFREYRWRWRRKGADTVVLPLPEWRGDTYPEGTILVISEQGKGDTLQFLRHLPLVKARVAKIIVACEASLHDLLAGMAEIDRVVSKQEVAALCGECTCYIPLLNLPEVLGTTLATIPNAVPYLHPDPARLASFRGLFAGLQGQCKVGLIWRGNPNHRNDRNRSCRPEDFSPLAGIEGVTLFSLQMGEPLPASLPGLIDLAPHIASFADTAALMAHLDLVVSVDTATAHLAGALGRPVWTLIPFVPDWRWMLNRDDTPWYPTMRLFRQSAAGNWAEVLHRVRVNLLHLQSRRKTSADGEQP